MSGYAGECLTCGWVGEPRDSHHEAELEAAEHAGYCAVRIRVKAERSKVRDEAIAKLTKALDAWHRADGGSGLKVASE